MTILGHLWIKDETTHLSEHLLRTDWLLRAQKWLLTSRFPSLRPSSLAGLRDVGPRRVQSSSFTCLKMPRATLSWRYGKYIKQFPAVNGLGNYFNTAGWKSDSDSSGHEDMLDLLLFSPSFLDDFRVWMWTLWSSNTSRSTRPPKWGDARIAPTAASTLTWALRATLRWSWPRRSRLSPNQRRRSPRRKRYEDVEDWHVQTNAETSVWTRWPQRRCTDDHLGHLWMNHENKLL